MIRLTRLNNQLLMINSDLIKCVESSPDTVITLVSGEKILVRETVEQILKRVVEFRISIAPPCGAKWSVNPSSTTDVGE